GGRAGTRAAARERAARGARRRAAARGPEAQSPRRLTRPGPSLVVGFGRVALGHHLGVELEERLAEAPHQPTVYGAGGPLPGGSGDRPACSARRLPLL